MHVLKRSLAPLKWSFSDLKAVGHMLYNVTHVAISQGQEPEEDQTPPSIPVQAGKRRPK
jgi:hypothetical protein